MMRSSRHPGRPGPALLMLVLWMVCVSTIAFAAAESDDAGLRSVFAHGAGNRGLAMGGAQAADVHGPSALIWNTGVLGYEQRYVVEATNTNLIGMGFNEKYLAAVIPSWRYGVTAFSLRTFGVGGIERRDDRNILLDSDLKDSQTEMMLGYGRMLGPDLSLGGAFKLRHHSLAGFSDTATGLDLGLHLRPLDLLDKPSESLDLQLGVSVHNLLVPSIRLDQESVADPRSIRSGLSMGYRFSEDIQSLLNLDLETVSGLDLRTHLGCELYLRRILALRLGSYNGINTFGFGVNWRDMQVDFAFEDNPLRSVKRLGLTLNFGSTSAQRRLDAELLADQNRRERLAAELARRGRKQVEELMHNAKKSERDGRFEDALEFLSMIRMLSPEEPFIPQHESRVKRTLALQLEKGGDLVSAALILHRLLVANPDDKAAQEALNRVNELSDQHAERSDQVREMFNASLDAFAVGDLYGARNGFTRLLSLSPDDDAASQMIDRVKEAFASRARSKIEEAKGLVRAGRFEEAEQALAEAGKDDPNADLDEARALIAQARHDKQLENERDAQQRAREADMARLLGDAKVQKKAADRTDGRKILSPDERQKVASLYARGLKSMAKGQTNEAVRILELVWSLDEGYEETRKLLCQEYLTRGMEAFSNSDLDTAIRNWENALRVDPQDSRAGGYLQRAHKQMDRIKAIRAGS